jgi:type II secretory pathway pseudopilin PulG
MLRPFLKLQFPNSTAKRRGISIIEVLVSLFILSVGLLGIASLLPIGQRQALLADQQDRLSALGQNAVRTFRTRGFSNFQWWRTAGGTSIAQNGSPGATAVFATAPIFIDPLMVEAQGNTVNKVPHNGTGLFDRFTLKQSASTGAGTSIGQAGAEAMFLSRDDVIVEPGTTPESATKAKYDSGRRDFDGEYSWAAMLSPTYPNNYPPGIAKGTPYPEQSCQLSIIVFYRRPLNGTAALNDSDTLDSTSIPRERVLGASFVGGGIGGGEITINGSTANMLVKIGEYVLVFKEGTGTTPYYAKWYRVIAAEKLESMASSRQLTLSGPDWPGATSGLQMVIFDGAVAVYNKSIRLEGPSMWNN